MERSNSASAPRPPNHALTGSISTRPLSCRTQHRSPTSAAVSDLSLGGAVIHPHTITFHISDRGVVADRRDTSGLRRPRRERRHHRGTAEEHHSASAFVGYDDRAVHRLGCVVRLTAHAGGHEHDVALGRTQADEFFRPFQRRQDRTIRTGKAQMPRRRRGRNRLAYDASRSVEKCHAIGIPGGDSAYPRGADDYTLGCRADRDDAAKRGRIEAVAGSAARAGLALGACAGCGG